MKANRVSFVVFPMLVLIVASLVIACAGTNQGILEKSGAQLWGENCLRCHNLPSPTEFGDDQWETIGMHMKLRANLTDGELEETVGFLQSVN